jgi:hypothetical protein
LNPRQPAWKAGTLPLSYARLFRNFLDSRIHHAKHLEAFIQFTPHKEAGWPTQARFGGQARIRTLEDISQQIYSLPPLAAWVPARNTSSCSTNQFQHTEDTLADHPPNKDKKTYPCTAFFLNPQRLIR